VTALSKTPGLCRGALLLVNQLVTVTWIAGMAIAASILQAPEAPLIFKSSITP
jgi:hypothetical protein